MSRRDGCWPVKVPERPPDVRIGAEHSPKGWRFAVRGKGIGVESPYRERIFVIFQRLRTKGEHPSTGVGLAICKKIVERHCGRIRAEPEPGKGRRFSDQAISV